MSKGVLIPKAQFLRTETEGANRNIGLDIARALCVVIVVASHTNNYFGKFSGVYRIVFPLGYMLQDLFFGLSGFLVGKQILRHINERGASLNLLTFYKNRWTRTMPFYLIFLLINYLLFLFAYRGSAERFMANDVEIWKYVFFVQNLNWRHPAFFPEIWPLPVEEWSFLLLPVPIYLLVTLFRRPLSFGQILGLLFVEIMLANIVRTVYVLNNDPETDWELRKIVIQRLDALLYGFAMHVLVERYRNFFFRNRVLLMTIGFVVCLSFYYSKMLVPPTLYKCALFTVLPLFMSLTLPYFYFSDFSKINESLRSMMVHVSLISYSVLLTHLYFIQFFMLWLYEPATLFEGLVFTVVYLSVLLIFSTVFFNYVERPVLMRRKK